MAERRKIWPDILSAVALLALITLGWCSANGIWSTDQLNLPSSYTARSKSDVIFHLALIRAAADGHFVPFCSKINPNLGAPFEANWNDWPITEEIPIFATGLLARSIGLIAALNVALLAGYLLCGITFYAVARYSKVGITWSFVSALSFGLACYLFAQSPDHFLLVLCWHLPLFLLVWNWTSSDVGVRPGSKRFWFSCGVAFVTGLQMPYYTGIFCQLVLIGALAMFARNRRLPYLLSAFCFIATAAFAFSLMNLDTWVYQYRFGPNSGALDRPYQWLELYGLKLVDFIVPPINHHAESFRRFAQWRGKIGVLADEGSYLGIIGIASVLLLAGRSATHVIGRRAQKIPIESWQTLWVILFFGTGGLNAILGLAGFTYFRAGCRYSVVIFVVTLLYAARAVDDWTRKSSVIRLFAATLACLLIFWDQLPAPPSASKRNRIAQEIASDRTFVKALERSLPDRAMIFQLPIMDFPEGPLPDVPSYDHLRPYLFSRDLRFSFGSMKGRSREEWQHLLTSLPLPQVIAEINTRGFAALYINRAAYAQTSIESDLMALGYHRKIENSTGDLVCYFLD